MVDFSKLFSLSGTVGSSWNLDDGDVVRTKSALQGLGYYKDAGSQRFETPGSGLTPFGSSKMISELVRFQGDNGLKQDGIMHPQGPTHQKMAELLGTRGVDAVDRTRPLQPAPFEPKPTKSIARLEKAEQSLLKDVGSGKPGTALKIKQLQDEKRLAERNLGQTGFKTVKINPLTGLAEKVKPERPKSPPKPILPQPQTMAMKQSSLLKGEPAKFNLDSPLGKQFMSAFADMKVGKPVPRANLDNLPDRVAETRGPDAQTMEIKPDDEFRHRPFSPERLEKNPNGYARNLSDKNSSEGSDEGTKTTSPKVTDGPDPAANKDRPLHFAMPYKNAKLRKNEGRGEGFFGAKRGGVPNAHKGVDIVAEPGTPVTAMASGRVTKTDGLPYAKGDMRYIEVEDQDGKRIRYMYVKADSNLKVGDRVEAGKTQIGTMQDVSKHHEKPGRPKMHNHLHLEVKDKKGNYLDPTNFMPWLKP